VTDPEKDYALQAEAEAIFAPADVLEALRIADVWETYYALPRANQDEFARWIEIAPNQAARWRRIDALVLALRLSPLVNEINPR
jgi:Bacteriocin-protection, YdeI or OmpD-Associated